MTVFELLSDRLQPASLGDSVAETLALALEKNRQVVPVVDEEERLVATVLLADLIACSDQERTLRDSRLHPPLIISADAHLFDAVQRVIENEVDLLSVVDESGRYLGSLDPTGLLRSVARLLGLAEEGYLIEIDVPPRDYSLGKLAHTIEEHGVRILSIYSEDPHTQDTDIRVTVKISASDTVRIRAVLEHYGYHVVAVERRRSSAEDIQQRVREFIHYLDV